MINAISQPLDLQSEAVLDSSVQFQSPLAENWANPQGIFLTGATGFLGAHLLYDLLQKTSAKIYCLLRCADQAQGQQRLQQHLLFYKLWDDRWHDRIIPVVGDLALPYFGLSQAQFEQLAQAIDVIYHNGAQVNSAVSYEVLKPANVLGTQEAIRLASLGGKVKPFHFISTLALFLSLSYAQVDTVTEADRPDLYSLKGGYKQSKAVAERLVEIAQERGLPASIYRPARIVGHQQTGITGNLNDAFCNLLKGCINLGQVPAVEATINLVPVDYVSTAIVHLSQQQNIWGKAFNLINPQSTSWLDFCSQIRALGYSLNTVSLEDFITAVQTQVQHNPDDSLYGSLMILLTAPVNLFSKKPPFQSLQTLKGLAEASIICPGIGDRLVSTYFSYFQESGYLPNPVQQISALKTQKSPATIQPTQSPIKPEIESPEAQTESQKKVKSGDKKSSGFWKSIRSNVKSKQEAFEIHPAPRTGYLPLSFGQERLWLIDQLQPNSIVHNLRAVFRIKGLLDPKILKKSLQEIIRRHEILRTTFPAIEGQPVQIITPELKLELPIVDLSSLPPARQEEEVRRIATEEAQTHFDLAQGPLIRFKLLHLSATHHVLVRTVHHIINDVWTDTIRTRELATLYHAFSQGESSQGESSQGKPSPLPDLKIQYADFAYAQRQWFQGKILDAQLNYWKKQLEPPIPKLQLPLCNLQIQGQNYRGAAQVLVLESELSESIKRLSHETGVSLFVTLLAAYKTLLNRYSGQEDLILICPVANRKQAVTKKLIGYFSNIVFVRTRLGGDPTFREILERVSQATLGAFEHQDIPCQQLAETFNVPSTALSRAMFTLQNVPSQPRELAPGIDFYLEEMEEGNSNFDLSLAMKEKGSNIIGIFRYKTSLFEEETIATLMKNFEELLQGLVANPDRPLSHFPPFAEFPDQPSFVTSSQIYSNTSYVPPQEELEYQLVEIWQGVLNLEKVGIHDNFFEIGGRSLAMIQVYSKLKKLGDWKISVGELFNYPTIHTMAQYLQHSQPMNSLASSR